MGDESGVAKKKKGGKNQTTLHIEDISDASLGEEAQRRYLNYALSVITSRALPDVRDGLKPVQRRILYGMWNELKLRQDVKYVKCARIVGDVMGKFHPHGDTAIYDALARMAQDFTLRAPLVDGRGNFGSPDGDSPAAMRYTEARLRALSEELLRELGQGTVAFRPNYDGTRFEPVVLPARFPNLLVNGSQGIAVGMATSIPPHNLAEVISACVALIDEPELPLSKLLNHIKGPDFPTGGLLVASKAELAAVYEAGQGSLKLRCEWKLEETDSRGQSSIIVTAIPYAVERRAVVSKVADVIIEKKLPPLVDVRDESDENCRIVLELKKGADPDLVMAYLFKHTPLASNVQVNLTCLVPTSQPDVAAPQRTDLKRMLRYFIDFRLEVVTKRLEFDLNKLRERIHLLEGLATIFDALDETIRIIRRSDGREDAHQKLVKRFELSDEQVSAILELRLYRLAKLQILLIREELDEKRKEAARIEMLLSSEKARWAVVRGELVELKDRNLDMRRTKVRASVAEPEFEAEDFIALEDAMVVLTQQGWIKRQQRVRDVSTTRVREGDTVVEVVAGSTRSVVAFFSNLGSCYVCRVVDVPQTTGYGQPAQSMFKMKDGERMVGMMGFDPRFFDVPEPTEGAEEPEQPWALAVTKKGLGLRFSLRAHRDPSTRTGRRYARLKTDDEVLYVAWIEPGEHLAVATREGRALICASDEISLLSGAGQGVMVIKLGKADEVVGAKALYTDDDALIVQREGGSEYRITTRKYQAVSRAGRGNLLFKRGRVGGVVLSEPTLPGFPAPEGEGEGDE